MACSGNPILGDSEAVSRVGINGTAKVFKNVRESPWDATLNKPVPRLIGMLVFQIGGQNLSRCFVIFLYEGVYL